jgi:hypothetical protein
MDTKKNANTPLFVRTKVIAERYSVTERSVFNWKAQGRIPFVQIGKTIRFPLCEVIEKLERSEA